jgi:hypothetical protein
LCRAILIIRPQSTLDTESSPLFSLMVHFTIFRVGNGSNSGKPQIAYQPVPPYTQQKHRPRCRNRC